MMTTRCRSLRHRSSSRRAGLHGGAGVVKEEEKEEEEEGQAFESEEFACRAVVGNGLGSMTTATTALPQPAVVVAGSPCSSSRVPRRARRLTFVPPMLRRVVAMTILVAMLLPFATLEQRRQRRLEGAAEGATPPTLAQRRAPSSPLFVWFANAAVMAAEAAEISSDGRVSLQGRDGDNNNGGGGGGRSNGKASSGGEDLVDARRGPPTPPPSISSSKESNLRIVNEGTEGDDEHTEEGEGDESQMEKHTCNCRYNPHDSHLSSSTTTTANNEDASTALPEGGARLAYLITVHNSRTITDAVALFRALRAPRTIVLIHVDARVHWVETYLPSALYNEVTYCLCGADVEVQSLYRPEWGEWSMNDPTHWCMEVLTSDPRFKDKWDVFVNLSGDALPVYTPATMMEWFDPRGGGGTNKRDGANAKRGGPLADTNFVTSSSCETGLIPTNVHIFPSHWHKRKHYVGDPSLTPATLNYRTADGQERRVDIEHRFGSQWMILTSTFVKHLMAELKREDSLASVYKKWLVDNRRLMSDETFVPTVLTYDEMFNSTLPNVREEDGGLVSMPNVYAVRYERMDEHAPSAFGFFPTQQRYDVPDSSDADVPRVWGPYFLGVYDLADVVDSGALFVRKVSASIDPNLINLLPVDDIKEVPYIRWPDEVKISEKPDWDRLKAELIRKAKEKEEKAAAAREKMTTTKKKKVKRRKDKDGVVKEDGSAVGEGGEGGGAEKEVDEKHQAAPIVPREHDEA